MLKELPHFTDAQILAARPPKNHVDPRRPYAFFLEEEYSGQGCLEQVATVFLTNRECPFRCLMCDLWKNTTDQSVAVGDIPAQIDFAFQQLGLEEVSAREEVRQVKLYNSGNFFDSQAIVRQDWPRIGERLVDFQRTIVENHPRLCNDACLQFRDSLSGELEIALGLETVHPEILPRLNKQMTLADFQRAVEFLRDHQIDVRAFILLKPPSLDEEEGVHWAIQSIQYAFDVGVDCCSVIPTRTGNGIMEQLQVAGSFQPPGVRSMEQVLEAGLQMKQGRVFMDLWDAEQFCPCQECASDRLQRLEIMNKTQQVPEPVRCSRSGCG
jgi:hypothetical protein